MKKLSIALILMMSCVLLTAQTVTTDSLAKRKATLLKYQQKATNLLSKTASFRAAGTLKMDSAYFYSKKDTTKEIYSYNTDGTVAQMNSFLWDNAKWINNERYLYTYTNGKVSSYIVQDSKTIGSVWENDFKEAIVYNTAGKIDSTLSYYPSNSTWILEGENKYVYDANNRLTSDTLFSVSSNVLTCNQVEGYTYDSNGNLIKKVEYGSAPNYSEIASFTYTYTNNSLFFSRENYNGGVVSYGQTYTYDASGNPTSATDSTYSSGTWVASSKSLYTYNTGYLASNINMPDGYKTIETKMTKLLYNNLLTAETNFTYTNGAWVSSGSTQYYYSNTSSSLNNAQTASGLKIIVKDGQAVVSGVDAGQTLNVYNIQGYTIYNGKTDGSTLTLPLPAHGMYVVKAGTESVKVVY